MSSPALNRLLTQALPWHPRRLFRGGVAGSLYLPRPATCRVLSDGTGSAAVVGDPVGWLMDESGNRNHLTQATTSKKPILRQNAGGRYYLEFDGVDDFLQATYPSVLLTPATLFLAIDLTLVASTAVIVTGATLADRQAFTYNAPSVPFRARIYAGLTAGFNLDQTPPLSVYTVTFSSSEASLRRNGVLEGSGGNSGVNNSSGITLGAHYDGSLLCRGDVFGLCHLAQLRTPAEVQHMERYLANLAGVAGVAL